LIWFLDAKAQNDYNSVLITDTIAINFQNHYTISQVHILPNTENIFLKGRKLTSNDYTIKYSEGYFTLSSSLPYSIFDTLVVTYRSLKLNLKKEYKRRSLVVKYDEKFGDTVSVLTSTSGGLSPDAIFGSDMQKSGTIVRGFTVGTTKDFSLSKKIIKMKRSF
jgi:hypothetical protein